MRSSTTEFHRSTTMAAENQRFSLVHGTSAQTVSDNICKNNILIWNEVLVGLPPELFQFTWKAMLQVLPTNYNLAKWNHNMISSMCSLCGVRNQNNKHVLSNCEAALDRYKIRHDAILFLLANWFERVKSSCSTLCVDLDGSTTFQSIGTVFQSEKRPDLVLFDELKGAVLELTICHESRILKSKSYKMQKYSDINSYLNPQFYNHNIKLFSVEISVLGFISDLTEFCHFTNIPDLPNHIKINIINSVISNSYNIYCLKNSKEQ